MDWRLELLSVVVTAGVVAWTATHFLVGALQRRRIVDLPNRRSSHDRPTPRGGGLGLLAGFLAALGLAALWSANYRVLEPTFLVALALVAGVGWLDDLKGGVSSLLRLSVQVVAAGLVLAGYGPLAELPLPAPGDVGLGLAGWAIGLVWIVAVVNLTNFLDGIDGFAAGQGLLAATGLAVAGFFLGSPRLLASGLALAGACAGFLPHNWQPARIFLGDVGSSSLGFVLATAAWTAGGDLPAGMRSELVFLTALLMWLFLADGSFTLARRALGGERVWRPHREHLYQRLVRVGWSHATTARRLLVVAAGPAALAVVGVVTRFPPFEWLALGVAALAFVSLVVAVARTRVECPP